MDMSIISQSKKMERYEKRRWEGGEREGRWEEVLDSSEMAPEFFGSQITLLNWLIQYKKNKKNSYL